MTMTRQWWVLGLSSMVFACEPKTELLEVGDEADTIGEDESDESDESDEGEAGEGSEADDEGEGGNPLECVEQGTNLLGVPEPGIFPLPTCEVDCAEGWGHGAPALAIEWTLPPNLVNEPAQRATIALAPNDELVVVLSEIGEDVQIVWLLPNGDQRALLKSSAIQGEVWEIDIGADGTIYALWTHDELQRLTAFGAGGDLRFSLELGPYQEYYSTLTAVEGGVVVALNPAIPGGVSRLVRVTSAGEIVLDEPIPFTWEIDVSPSGEALVLANMSSVTWVDMQANVLASQGLADVWMLLGMVAIDDERMVIAGGSEDTTKPDGVRGYLRQVGPMGLEWSFSYDRADAWCSASDDDVTSSDELFVDLARLADGSFVVAGIESLGHPGFPGETQPWVAHVSAEGEVLATDRGFWIGRTVTVAAGDDEAYVLMTLPDGDPDQQYYVRKYAL